MTLVLQVAVGVFLGLSAFVTSSLLLAPAIRAAMEFEEQMRKVRDIFQQKPKPTGKLWMGLEDLNENFWLSVRANLFNGHDLSPKQPSMDWKTKNKLEAMKQLGFDKVKPTSRGKWSKEGRNCCYDCRTRKKPHHALGRCRSCYFKLTGK